MDKTGKLGLRLNFYAVLAFVLALFGQLLLAGILLGVVLVVERDEWTGRQCMEAFFLTLLGHVVGLVQGVFNTLRNTFSSNYYYEYSLSALFNEFNIWTMFNTLFGLASLVVDVLIIIFALMAISKVAKGGEAGTPIVSKWAWAAYGKFAPQPVRPQPQQQPVQQPMGQQGYPSQPMPQQPVGQPPMGQPGQSSQAGQQGYPAQPGYQPPGAQPYMPQQFGQPGQTAGQPPLQQPGSPTPPEQK